MYPIRKELVGKRFMCVADKTQNGRPNSRSNRASNPLDYAWRCGIIRACTEEDSDNIDQKVLVEYDNQDWTTREWISIYKGLWKIFLVEKTMVWAQRDDPNKPKRPILWPALTFYSLVDKHDLEESSLIGVEFLGDHKRSFCNSNEMRPYQEDDGLQPALRNNSKLVNELVNWQTLQKSQGILNFGPFSLTGFRVQVYREKCRQWFSAVITSHDLITREMDVMDDTVLQTHRVNPKLIMVLLLANDVELDGMLRGDSVRVLPSRRKRQSQVVITTPSSETSSSGNTMWQFLNDILSNPNASYPQSQQNTSYPSPSPTTTSKTLVTDTTTSRTTTTTCRPATQTRRTSNSNRHTKRRPSRSPEHTVAPPTQQQQSEPRLTSPHQQRDVQNISSSPKLSSFSPVTSSSGHRLPSPSHQGATYFTHHRYGSMENLSSSSPSRQLLSPPRPSSTSKLSHSPQRPAYTSPCKTPPADGQSSPPKIVNCNLGYHSPASHSRQFTPPHSSPSFSPYRTTKLSPAHVNPMLGGNAYKGGGLGAASNMLQSLQCRDPAGHVTGACSCNSKHSLAQSTLSGHLYALQVQQQQVQQKNLSQCQIYLNQLQLIAEQYKMVQQGKLTPEQVEQLNFYYKQIMHQYQEATTMCEYSSNLAASQMQMQMMQYLEEQEKLKHLQLYEPERLQTFFTHAPNVSNAEQLEKLCASLAQHKKDEVKEAGQDRDDSSLKDHVAKLKRFMPIVQQGKSSSPSSSYSPSTANNTATIKKPLSITGSTIKFPIPSHLPLSKDKEDNKTDDQKAVAAMSITNPSLPETRDLSHHKELQSNPQVPKASTISSNTNVDHIASTLNNQIIATQQKQETLQNKDPEDLFGFDKIGDDVPKPKSKSTSKSSTSQHQQDPFGFDCIGDDTSNSKLKTSNRTHDTKKKLSKDSLEYGESDISRLQNYTYFTDKPLLHSKTPTSKLLSSSLAKEESPVDSNIMNRTKDTDDKILQDADYNQVLLHEGSSKSKQNSKSKSCKVSTPPLINTIPTRKGLLHFDKELDKEAIQTVQSACDNDSKLAAKQPKSKKRSNKQQKASCDSSKTTSSESSPNAKNTNAKLLTPQNQETPSSVEKSVAFSEQDDSLNGTVAGRASVIRYVHVDNKSNLTGTSPVAGNNQVVLPVKTDSLPFSVDQLLEFQKTSNQAVVTAFGGQKFASLFNPEQTSVKSSNDKDNALHQKQQPEVKPLNDVNTVPVQNQAHAVEFFKKLDSLSLDRQAQSEENIKRKESVFNEKKTERITGKHADQLDVFKVLDLSLIDQKAQELIREQRFAATLDKQGQKAMVKNLVSLEHYPESQAEVTVKSSNAQTTASNKQAQDEKVFKWHEISPATIGGLKVKSIAPKRPAGAKGFNVTDQQLPNSQTIKLAAEENKTVKEEKKKCNKKRKKNKDVPPWDGQIPNKKAAKFIPQAPPTVQRLFSDPLPPGQNKTMVSSGQTLGNRYLGMEGKSRFFPEISTEEAIPSLAQQSTTSETQQVQEQMLAKLECQEVSKDVQNNTGQKMTETKTEVKKPETDQINCEANRKMTETVWKTPEAKQKKIKTEKKQPVYELDWRMARERLSPAKTPPSLSYEMPVNFIADQNVKNLMRVNQDQEPISLSALLGAQCVLRVDNSQCSVEDGDQAEQRRKRKKSRKILDVLETKETMAKTKDTKKPKKVKVVSKEENNMEVQDTESGADKLKEKKKGKKRKEEVAQDGQSLEKQLKKKKERKNKELSEGDLKEQKKKNKKKTNDEQEGGNVLRESIGEKSEDHGVLQESAMEDFQPRERTWSEETIELDCNERIAGDVTAESEVGEAKVQDEEKIKVSEEKPIKEIIEKLAAKKKERPSKRKNQDDTNQDKQVKKRKVRPPKEEFFVQNGSCAMFPKLPPCRDCRVRDDKTTSPNQNCCRFTSFRRLKKKVSSGRIQVAGFMLPENAGNEDMTPWIASENATTTLTKEGALYILNNIADEFCSLVQEEQRATIREVKPRKYKKELTLMSYKRAVTGLREMCDACATTIFNVHWVCHKCGFGVCLDCYNLRVKEKNNTQHHGRRGFQFKWFHCIPGNPHQPRNLTIAQIIPKEVLNDLSNKLHQIRTRWKLGDECPCQRKKEKPMITEITDIKKEPTSVDDDSRTVDDEDMSVRDESKSIDNDVKYDINNSKSVEDDAVSVAKSITIDLKPIKQDQTGKEEYSDYSESQKDIFAANKETNFEKDESKLFTNNVKSGHNLEIIPNQVNGPQVQNSSKQEKRDYMNNDNEKSLLEKARQRVKEREETHKNCSVSSSADKGANEGHGAMNTDHDKDPVATSTSSLCSGLSLLLSYNSSSENSAENSPQQSHSTSSGSAFDFNLGLLAQVAVKLSPDKKKDAEIKNNEKQSHLLQDSATTESTLESKMTSNKSQQDNTKETNLSSTKTLSVGKDKPTCTVTESESTHEDETKADRETTLLSWFKKAEENDKSKSFVSSNEVVTSSTGESTCFGVTMETRDQSQLDLPISTEEYPAPHSFLCNGRLLRLHEPHHPGNQDAFAKRWIEGKPILISNIDKLLDKDLWSPESFEKEFGKETSDVVNCRNGKIVENFSVGEFWKGFESVQDRACDGNGEPMLLKLKDWPPGTDFCEKLPTRFENLMDNIPLPAYTRRDGSRNLASRLPDFFVKPDLGPKMYNAYGSAAFPTEGTTNLHIDMSDAVNVMVYVGVPRDAGAGEREREAAIKCVDIACDKIQQQRVRRETARIGALWHIFEVDDADKIREFLLEIAKERKLKYSAHQDPIHDQCFYIDEELRARLKQEYNVEGYAICQCLGDGVFIPAGAPHQVRNLYSCVKIAEDFVSPERIGQCFKTTQEFRHLSDKHTNHEDKLQIKNIIYHAVKDAVHVLEHHEKQDHEEEKEKTEL